jgi:hypothetical protein
MAEKETFYGATLVNGELYVLGDKPCPRGKEVRVTEAEKEHLELHAVDVFPVGKSGDKMERQKFEFRELKAGEDVTDADAGKTAPKPVAIPARQRARS